LAVAILLWSLLLGFVGWRAHGTATPFRSLNPVAPLVAGDCDALDDDESGVQNDESRSIAVLPEGGSPETTTREVEIAFSGNEGTWLHRGVVLFLIVPDGGRLAARVEVTVGRTVLCAVPVGSWRVELHDRISLIRLGVPSQNLTETDTRLSFCLPDGCVLSGSIAEANGRPFVGTVCVDSFNAAKTSASGEFCAGFVHAGRRGVEVWAGSGLVTVGSIDVEREGDQHVDLRIKGGGSVRGELVGGDTATSVVYYIVTKGGQPVADFYWDLGSFTLGYLESGQYTLKSAAIRTVDFAIEPGDRTELGPIERLPIGDWVWR
jgi:hypothetical protein